MSNNKANVKKRACANMFYSLNRKLNWTIKGQVTNFRKGGRILERCPPMVLQGNSWIEMLQKFLRKGTCHRNLCKHVRFRQIHEFLNRFSGK